jgi:8-oxo-dGTP diphosphatase
MILVVCGVIHDGEGNFLACKRSAEKHLGGLWEFPGGKVEDGEPLEDALRRELMEELEIEIEMEVALEPVDWVYDRGAIRLLPFLCRISKGTPRALEHEQLLWSSPDDFDTLEWAAADLPILDQLRGLRLAMANPGPFDA